MLRFRNLIFQTAVSCTRRNRSFNPPYFRLLACVKCSMLHLQQYRWVLLWDGNLSLQHGFWPTRNVPASIRLSALSSAKNASWMISLWSEATWSYSGGISGEIVNSAGLDQVRLTTSEMFWNLRFLTARGHIHENIFLDKLLFFIRIDIFHTSCLKWYY